MVLTPDICKTINNSCCKVFTEYNTVQRNLVCSLPCTNWKEIYCYCSKAVEKPLLSRRSMSTQDLYVRDTCLLNLNIKRSNVTSLLIRILEWKSVTLKRMHPRTNILSLIHEQIFQITTTFQAKVRGKLKECFSRWERTITRSNGEVLQLTNRAALPGGLSLALPGERILKHPGPRASAMNPLLGRPVHEGVRVLV